MANVTVPNFLIPGASNIFQCIWKLTRTMKKAGWNTVSHSDGVTKTAAGTNGNDSWGSNADPLLDAYPNFDAAAPWIVMRGPTTLKIPLQAAPTGTPLRGEAVSQAVSGATGEILGFVWDSVGSSGWMVIAPRTGTFNNTNIITGASSAATMTPTGTIVSYVREVMFGKPTSGSNVQGQIWYICADVSGESAQLFSTLATSAGCTATVPPASGGTGNAFPALAIAIKGTGGAVTTGEWAGGLTTNFSGNSQMSCANAIIGSGVSADGSFFLVLSNTLSAASYTGFGYFRVDDGEPGDVDPYVFCNTTSNTYGVFSRTANSSYGQSQATFAGVNMVGAASYPLFYGYLARGCPVTARDIVNGFTGSVADSAIGSTFTHTTNFPATVRLTNHPAATPPLVREALLIYSGGSVPSSLKNYKGRARWIQAISQGSILDTYDNKQFICVNTITSTNPAIALGPWDGTSTPSA